MNGYFQSPDDGRQRRNQVLALTSAAAIAAGIFHRERLGRFASSQVDSIFSRPGVQDIVSRTVTKTADFLQSTSDRLEEGNSVFRPYFKKDPGAVHRRRQDFVDFRSRDREAARLILDDDAASRMKLFLGSPNYAWNEDSLGKLFSSSSLVRSVLGSEGESPDLIAGMIKKRLRTDARGFYDHLEKTSPDLETAIDKAARDLTHARTWALREQKDFREEIFNQGSSLQEGLRDEFLSQLNRDGGKASRLESLTGLHRSRIGVKEAGEIREHFSGVFSPGFTPENLRKDWRLGQFEKDGKSYDLSGYRRIFQKGIDSLDRIQFPMSPLFGGVSPKQLFGFAKADQPRSGVLKRGFGGSIAMFLGEREFTFDPETGSTVRSDKRFRFLSARAKNDREMLDAEKGAGDSWNPFSNLRHGLDVNPGSVPYQDVPRAFFRKWSSRTYTPNLLKNASLGTLNSPQEARDLVTTLERVAPLGLTDDSIGHAFNYLRDKKIETGEKLIRKGDGVTLSGKSPLPGDYVAPRIDESFGDIATRLSMLDGLSSDEKFAAAIPDIAKFYKQQSGGSGRVRGWLSSLEQMSHADRVMFLGRTADYGAGKEPERLFGLANPIGRERLTQTDLLRADLLSDVLKFSQLTPEETHTGSGSLSGLSGAFTRGQAPNAALLTHARSLDFVLSESKVAESVHNANGYIQGSEPFQEQLRSESNRKYSWLHLHPATPEEYVPFDERKRFLKMERGNHSLGRLWRSFTGGETSEGDANFISRGVGFFVSHLHAAFESVGAGLPDIWKTSPGRMAFGMGVFRFAPLLGLIGSHKLYNRITRDVPFLNWANLDHHRANVLSLIGDITHRGGWRAKLRSLFPGLSFYIDGKSKEEQDRHDRGAGYTAVRKGRWWAFGSKEAFFGEKVSYFLPSAERIARSDWQGAENVDRNTWDYWKHRGGYFNPLNWGKGAYHWENKHFRDRPFVASGAAFDSDLPLSGILNATLGRILKPRLIRKDLVPKRLGGELETQEDRATDPTKIPGAAPIWKPLFHRKLKDPSKDKLLRRINALRALRGEESLHPGAPMSSEEKQYARSLTFEDGPGKALYHAQEIGGLYGFFAGRLASAFGIDISRPSGVKIADASESYGLEKRFYDQEIGGIGGNVADTLRRFLPHRRRSLESYNPIRNTMPDWMNQELKYGDPYNKIAAGEMRLPGEAFERLHPGVKDSLFRMRASSLGKTQEEIENYFVHKAGDGRTSRAAEMGTEMHRIVQDRWRKLGFLEEAETYVFDKEFQTSGHIDAILRMPDSRGRLHRVINDIKTKNQTLFDEIKKSGKASDENLDQILFYMHTTGIRKGILTYVNRDDENHETFNIEVKYDKKRIAEIKARLDAARANVKAKVESGEIHRGQLYDLVTQYEILSDVAPSSDEFSKVRQIMGHQKEALRQDERQRVDDADTRRKKVRDGFELHAYRFLGIKDRLHSRQVKVAKIHAGGRFEDTKGQTYQIAGIEKIDEETLRTQGGLSEGDNATVMTGRDGSSKKAMSAAIFAHRRNIGKSLIASGVKESTEDFSAPSVVSRFSNSEIAMGAFWEKFSHIDSAAHTKFLPVRSGLEQYERTDVYGKKGGSWDSPIKGYLIPTLVSMTNKGIVPAALLGGMVGSLFFPLTRDLKIAAGAGAVVGAAISLFGAANRMFGKPWIAPAVRKRRELDEYYDTLTYVKYRRLAAQAEARAAEEGENINEVESRQNKKGMVNWSISRYEELALLYRRRYRATLRGALGGGSSWDAVLSALPDTSRSSIVDVIQHGSTKEKKKLYSLLPDYQKAVLGYKLGIDPRKIPKLASLEEYAKKHAIPDENYAGFRSDISLDMIKAKDIQERKLDPIDFGIYPGMAEKAISASPEAFVKTPRRATKKTSSSGLHQKLRNLLRGHGLTDIDIAIDELPTSDTQDSHEADVEVNVTHDRTHSFFQQYKKLNLRRA